MDARNRRHLTEVRSDAGTPKSLILLHVGSQSACVALMGSSGLRWLHYRTPAVVSIQLALICVDRGP